MKQSKSIGEKFFCAAPASSLFVDPFGKISSCCSGTSYYGNLASNIPLDQIIHSDLAVEVRKNVEEGKVHSYCSGCARSELIANDSQRAFYKTLEVSNPSTFKLKSLDLRWSSVCNFACIYCSENWSSTWNRLKGIPFSKSENLKRVNEILEFIKKHGSDSIEQVLLAGGEPLVQVQNEELLNILPEKCRIFIITNLGVDLEKSSIFQKLKNRSEVTWTISLENIKEKFEYVRQGGKWSIIEKNLETIVNTPGHRFFFLSVFNILSAWDIEEYSEFARNLDTTIAWQTIKDQRNALDPNNFNSTVIKKVVEKLENQKNLTKLTNRNNNMPASLYNNENFIPQTLQYLQTTPRKVDGDKEFRKFITNHEQKYNISGYKFKDLWPDLDNFIQKDLF